jgi:plasmid stabilization system protein ParE
MSGRVWKCSAAAADVVECATYLGQRNPSAADRFLDAVEDGIDLLADMPQLGAVYDTQNPRLGVSGFGASKASKSTLCSTASRPTESRSSG